MLYHGACYYPEHWTGEQAVQHVPLMHKAGFNVVRMGEFAWCKFEPEPGRYRFDWLDPTIEALDKAGIRTVLGTPTNIPPQWLVVTSPDILQRDADGLTRNPGARCHACKNAPAYRLACEGIVRELAKHYAGLKAVIGWQVDNEFGNHLTTRCYCPHCEEAFRAWLRQRYGSVEAVNAAWGGAFWGFEFRQWNEVPLPRRMPAGPNPGHWLDFCRFSSDTQVGFMKMQRDIIREYCPGHFVTHNFMGCFSEIDYHILAREMDFPSWDNYPSHGMDPLYTSYAHEITRSFRGAFWVMEQKSGPTGDAAAGIMGEQPEPGELRRWAWQAIANGADGVVYFRWRVCLTGAEQYWHGILDHDGVPRRRYREVCKVSREFDKVGKFLEKTKVKSKVALIRSFENLWLLERQPGASGFRYDEHCFELYRAAKSRGLSVDMVDGRNGLGDYAVLFAPALAMVDAALVERLTAFVTAGGTLIFTPQSGTRTTSAAMSDATRPGPLAPLVGATVEEVRPYHRGQTSEITFARGALVARQSAVGRWVEVLECHTAEAIAEYRDERFAGKAAITRNSLGKGSVYYLGVYLSSDILGEFLADLLPEFAIKGIPEGVEITQRRGPKGRLVFVLNHTEQPQSLTLPGEFADLLSGERVGPKAKISANGVLVLKAAH